jgi:hypothetical protein
LPLSPVELTRFTAAITAAALRQDLLAMKEQNCSEAE